MEDIPMPGSVADLEGLVNSLYQPRNTREVAIIEKQLQSLQRSDQGWQMADTLLASQQELCRFFGALTLTVKLKQDWDKIPHELAQTILPGILTWLTRLVAQRDRPMVLRKLCSTLAVYYTTTAQPWSLCIRQVICSFCRGGHVHEDALNQFPQTAELVLQLNLAQIETTLWFCTNLIEEVGKLESIAQRTYYDRLPRNLADYEALLHHSLAGNISAESLSTDSSFSNLSVREAALDCLKAWASHAASEWMTEEANLRYIRSLLQPGMNCMALGVSEAVDTFIDVLNSSPSLFQSEHRSYLESIIMSQWALSHISNLHTMDPETSSVQFAKLLAAYGEFALKELIETPESPGSHHILGILHSLLQCPGYAAVDDTVALAMIEFWNAYVDAVQRAIYDAGDQVPDWLKTAKLHTLQAIRELCVKSRLPPPSEWSDWDSESKQAFKSFRADFRDLLENAEFFVGTEMLQEFSQSTLQAVAIKGWLDVEVSLYCLNSIADLLNDDGSHDSLIAKWFGSELLTSLSGDDSVPASTRRAAVDMVGKYSTFFTRNPGYLPGSLNFLFSTLKSANTALTAAKSISSLCSECRASLTPHLEAFFKQYEEYLAWPTAEGYTKEKVIGGIAAIVQTLPPGEMYASLVERLLGFVDQDVRRCLELAASGRIEESQVAAHESLRCLTSMSKSLQAPDSVVIDLDANPNTPNYWNDGPGNQIQQHIVRLMEMMMEVHGNDGDVIEGICCILRAGYKEKTPGPFVLPSKVTMDFVVRITAATPRLPYVMETSSIWVNATDSQSFTFEIEARRLLAHIVVLLQQLGTPDSDPEASASIVDVLHRYASRHLTLLATEPPTTLEYLFNWTVACIRQDDLLPKRSALQLWALLIKDRDPEKQPEKDIVAHFGEAVCEALIWNAAGEMNLSHWIYLSPPLRQLMGLRQGRLWIESAVGRCTKLPVDNPAGSRFVQGLKIARNNKTVEGLLREFWHACRRQGSVVVDLT